MLRSRAEILKEGYVACLTFTAFVMVAACKGFVAFQLPQLQDKSSDIKITDEQASWIATLTILPNPIGSILGGLLMDLIGRKLTLQLIFLPFAVAWAIIGFSSNVETIYLGTFLSGVAAGACYCSSTYIAEICTAEHRGPLLGFLEPTYTFGVLLCNLLVHNLGWRASAYCFVCASLTCFLLIFLLPESPSWLVTRGEREKATRVLVWLRGDAGEAEREVVEIESSLQMTNSPKRKSMSFKNSIADVFKSWKPLAILVGLVTLQRICGCPILESYTVKFFESLRLPFDSRIAAIYHSSANFAGSFFTPLAVQKLPRRVLLGLTSCVMGVCMLCVALYELKFYEPWPSVLSVATQPYFYLVLCSIYVYDVASTLGVLPLPFILSGELFPTENRGIMNGIYCCFSFLISAIVVKTFPTFLSVMGIIYVVMTYSFVNFFTILYGKYVLPETRGKTLPEIQVRYFKRHGQQFVENMNF